MANILRYDRPAAEWTEALPLGNGRLGAMVHAGVGREELQLNEASLWSGGPYLPVNPDALPNLEQVRALIFAGRYTEAHQLAEAKLLAKPSSQMSYQPAGNVFLEFTHEAVPGTYERTLDLETAVATTRYALLGTGFEPDAPIITRSAFVSATDDAIIMQVESSGGQGVSFELWFDSPQQGDIAAGDASGLSYRGHNFGEHGIAGQLTFGVDVDLRVDGGQVERRGRRLLVRNAQKALIVMDIATSFVRFDDVSGDPDALLSERRKRREGLDYQALLDRHIASYRQQFDRMAIDLGAGRDDLTTDRRIQNFAAGDDPALAALYVQYGRYLMISSSRSGTQPATLQGIWNRHTRPPWGSKYTCNINLQMNYWLPDPANLLDMVEPLIAMVEDLAITGRVMARQHYGARGWVMHHNTDIWRATGPIDGVFWGLWPMGGAWLMAHLWDHVRFAGRPEHLIRRIYEPLKGAVEFALDVLTPLPGTNYLVTAPSLSPENAHPFGTSLCAGPAMDNQILRDLFAAFGEASALLGEDTDLTATATTARARLPEHRIGSHGQLQEWLDDWDMDAPERHHRHVSHLYGLYPSDQISLDTTPELAEAAEKSLQMRGDEATGWGIGWRINLWARLRRGNRAYAVLQRLLSPGRSYPNLFDAHPPFQIDGNFGGAAGILEMLVQSSETDLYLLPALPDAWPAGKLRGVRAHGGLEVDMAWAKGRVASLSLRSTADRQVNIRSGDAIVSVALKAGAETTLSFY